MENKYKKKEVVMNTNKKSSYRMKNDSPKSKPKLFNNYNLNKKLISDLKLSREIPHKQKNRSMIEETNQHHIGVTSRYNNKTKYALEGDYKEITFQKKKESTTHKSKLVESILGKMNLPSKDQKPTFRNLSMVKTKTNNENLLKNDEINIKEVNSNNPNFINYTNLTKRGNSRQRNANLSMNHSQNMSFNNTFVKNKRGFSVTEETSIRLSDRANPGNLFFSRGDSDTSQIKEILKDFIEEASINNTNLNKSLLDQLLPELLEAINKKSKDSTRDDTKQSFVNKECESIEHLHFTFVTFFQKYKRMVSNQENLNQSRDSIPNDQTVIKIDEIEFS